jgi:DNA-binding NarL/FixJ family response regulator
MSNKPKCILLVDDNPQVRHGLRQMFETEGFICGECENGAQAVEDAKKLNPDLIVLDLSMPVMNGMQAAPLLRKMLPQTPIIMFTMFANETLMALALAAGVAAVVSKEHAASHLLPKAQSLLCDSRSVPPANISERVHY